MKKPIALLALVLYHYSSQSCQSARLVLAELRLLRMAGFCRQKRARCCWHTGQLFDIFLLPAYSRFIDVSPIAIGGSSIQSNDIVTSRPAGSARLGVGRNAFSVLGSGGHSYLSPAIRVASCHAKCSTVQSAGEWHCSLRFARRGRCDKEAHDFFVTAEPGAVVRRKLLPSPAIDAMRIRTR
jgi:hypothetical protein